MKRMGFGNRTGKGRHAADRRAPRPRTAAAYRSLAATRQRLRRMIHPTRVPRLGGTVIDGDTPAWQVMIRAAQTPAFGIVLIVGLVLAGFGTASFPLLARSLTQQPTHSLTPHPAPGPAPPLGRVAGTEPGWSVYPAPTLGDTQGENPGELGHNPTRKINDEATKDEPDREAPRDNPELDAALKELEEEADRDEAWASKHPAPPLEAPACSPNCTDSAAPTP